MKFVLFFLVNFILITKVASATWFYEIVYADNETKKYIITTESTEIKTQNNWKCNIHSSEVKRSSKLEYTTANIDCFLTNRNGKKLEGNQMSIDSMCVLRDSDYKHIMSHRSITLKSFDLASALKKIDNKNSRDVSSAVNKSKTIITFYCK